MNSDGLAIVPAAHRDPARAALAAAFGAASGGATTPMMGGATSASVFRIEIGHRRYVIRMEGEPSPLRNPHQYLSMRIAAEAGIAPKIHYIEEVARVAVIDFIQPQPRKGYPGGQRALAQALGKLLSRVQAMPVFPTLVDSPHIAVPLIAH